MTDVVDGPLGSGQPVGDRLPTPEHLPSPSQKDGRTADPAQSANDSADTKPLIVEPTAISLRRRLTRAVPGHTQSGGQNTLVPGTEALLAGSPTRADDVRRS